MQSFPENASIPEKIQHRLQNIVFQVKGNRTNL